MLLRSIIKLLPYFLPPKPPASRVRLLRSFLADSFRSSFRNFASASLLGLSNRLDDTDGDGLSGHD